MKKSVKIKLIVSIAVVLIAAAALLLPSLLKKEEWTPMNHHLPMSKNGLVSWTPFVSAIGYGYYFVGENGNRGEQGYTEETSVQLKEGRCLRMWPVYASGRKGKARLSEHYTPPVKVKPESNGADQWFRLGTDGN